MEESAPGVEDIWGSCLFLIVSYERGRGRSEPVVSLEKWLELL